MPAADATPIGDDEADALFARLDGAGVVIAAVSGGKDSLALLDLLARWRKRRRGRPIVHVATVDHGLRRQSRSEAEAVAIQANRRMLPSTMLVWDGPKPRTGIEAAAREARYTLLAQLAQDLGAPYVVTAHHREDQAETVLLRLGRGSGLAGLAGMREDRVLAPQVRLFRPFLAIAAARLAATTAAAGLVPADDASNRDLRFARPRLRQSVAALASEGLTPEGLARTAARLARADAALEHYATELVARAASVGEAGALLNRAVFVVEPAEVQARALVRLLRGVGKPARPPRSERVDTLLAAIGAGRPFRRTLGGAVVASQGEWVTLTREPPRRAARMRDGSIEASAEAVDSAAD